MRHDIRGEGTVKSVTVNRQHSYGPIFNLLAGMPEGNHEFEASASVVIGIKFEGENAPVDAELRFTVPPDLIYSIGEDNPIDVVYSNSYNITIDVKEWLYTL